MVCTGTMYACMLVKSVRIGSFHLGTVHEKLTRLSGGMHNNLSAADF